MQLRSVCSRPASVLLVKCVLGLAGLAGLMACSSAPGVTRLVTPYRLDIQQGNVVTREQADALKPGMPRVQVRDILGSPLLTSVFHADRWDYVFTFQRQGQEPQERKLTVFFKEDVVERVDADALPTEADFVASLDARRIETDKAPALEASEAQLKAFAERNPAPAAGAAPATTGAAPVVYPPLESAGASR